MAINQKRYIDTTSGVGGAAQAAGRELIARIFSVNSALTAGELFTATSSTQVSNKFGADSEEFDRAVFYFGFITKQIRSPKKMSFYGVTVGDPVVVADLVAQFVASIAQNNNFGSWCLTYELIEGLDAAELTALAIALGALNASYGNMFQFHFAMPAADSEVFAPKLNDFGGLGVTLKDAVDFQEMQGMCILAATDFEAPAAAQNYMFTQSTLVTTVDNDDDADKYDLLNINYMGETQFGGKGLKFYQRGYLMGLPTDARDMGVYANEQWFKDAVAAGLMNMIMANVSIQANQDGEADVLSAITPIVGTAKINGTISQGKALTPEQKVFVRNASKDERAHFQVENQGYWLGAGIISEIGDSGITEYTATYTLIYAKNDSIRKIVGAQILI